MFGLGHAPFNNDILRKWQVNTTPALAAWPQSSQKGFPWPHERENRSTGLATKFLFPFQLQDTEYFSLLPRGFRGNLLVVRDEDALRFPTRGGSLLSPPCRRWPYPHGIATF